MAYTLATGVKRAVKDVLTGDYEACFKPGCIGYTTSVIGNNDIIEVKITLVRDRSKEL